MQRGGEPCTYLAKRLLFLQKKRDGKFHRITRAKIWRTVRTEGVQSTAWFPVQSEGAGWRTGGGRGGYESYTNTSQTLSQEMSGRPDTQSKTLDDKITEPPRATCCEP